jgi:hypothetical protein
MFAAIMPDKEAQPQTASLEIVNGGFPHATDHWRTTLTERVKKLKLATSQRPFMLTGLSTFMCEIV